MLLWPVPALGALRGEPLAKERERSSPNDKTRDHARKRLAAQAQGLRRLRGADRVDKLSHSPADRFGGDVSVLHGLLAPKNRSHMMASASAGEREAGPFALRANVPNLLHAGAALNPGCI